VFLGIGLTPLIALIYVSVEPAVTQNCVASVTNKKSVLYFEWGIEGKKKMLLIFSDL
jgi:hypothetical protein